VIQSAKFDDVVLSVAPSKANLLENVLVWPQSTFLKDDPEAPFPRWDEDVMRRIDESFAVKNQLTLVGSNKTCEEIDKARLTASAGANQSGY
tara:strand:+ start:1512 stop:1787 length:276 start_codon:yes stop_codon:yes gene_type:complete